MTENEILSTKEAAAYCRVSTETIRRWIKYKGLRAFNTGSRLVIKIRKEDLDSFVRENNILVDESVLSDNGNLKRKRVGRGDVTERLGVGSRE